MNLDELRTRTTITVPEAGQVLGIGRDAAYAAAERGEIPVLRLGRRVVVPVPKLLLMLGEEEQGTSVGMADGREPRSFEIGKPAETVLDLIRQTALRAARYAEVLGVMLDVEHDAGEAPDDTPGFSDPLDSGTP